MGRLKHPSDDSLKPVAWQLRWSGGGWSVRMPLWSLFIVLVLGGLNLWGTWFEWERYAIKRAQWAAFSEHVNVQHAPVLTTTTPQRFTRHVVVGHFDPQRQLWLANKARGGQPGFHIVNVLYPDNAPHHGVLVNMGWVPRCAWNARHLQPSSIETMPAACRVRTKPPKGHQRVQVVWGVSHPPASWVRARWPGGQPPWRLSHLLPEQVEQALNVQLVHGIAWSLRPLPNGPTLDVSQRALIGLSPERHLTYAIEFLIFALIAWVGYATLHVHRLPETLSR